MSSASGAESVHGRYLMIILIGSILILGLSHNPSLAQPSTSEKLPDLMISNVKWYPKNPIAGEEVKFKYTITDVSGGDPSYNNRPFLVSLYVDDEKVDEHTVKYYGKMDVDLYFKKPWIATDGEHSIKIVVNDVIQNDDKDKHYPINFVKMQESSEKNNESVIKLSAERFKTSEPPALLRIYTQPAIPDLKIKIDGVDYTTNKDGIISARILKGWHNIKLQELSVTSELEAKHFKYWKESKMGRSHDSMVNLNIVGKYCFLTAVFDNKYKASFTTEGLPDGAKVRLTIEEPTLDKVWSEIYTVPFKFTIPEWLNTKTTLKFAVDPVVNFGNEVYRLKVWKDNILLSENPTFGISLAPDLYIAVFEKDPYAGINVSTNSVEYKSGDDLAVKIAGIPNDLAMISLINLEGKEVKKFYEVLDSQGSYEGKLMSWHSWLGITYGEYTLNFTFGSNPLAGYPTKVVYKSGE